MLGAGLTVDRDGVMVGANDAKFGEKRRFGKLVVSDKKGEEGGDGLTMDTDFYQRGVL